MKAGSSRDALPKSCGKCGKTIRMRDDTINVLCTDVLGVVDAGFEDVCEHYVERPEFPGQQFQAPSSL